MLSQILLRIPDLLVILLTFGVMVFIGGYCARRNKSSETYFLAGRNMPGWVVGFSLMATGISSMTFLAAPGFAFKENWRYMPCHVGYIVALIVMVCIYMPFFRRSNVSSAYEYLERRFGSWARIYAALSFILFQMTRLGVILYAVCLPIKEMTGFGMPVIIIFFGIIVAAYTIAGGLEAVIWTDLLQGLALIIGGFICLPIVLMKLPGGWSQLMEAASADSKMSMGATAFTFSEKTIWVMMLMSLFNFLQLGCTDQMTIQRYIAPRNEKEARKALYVGGLLSLPVWVYFTFIGTAIYVFYKAFPDPEVNNIVPERVLSFFILREVPAGLAGFVIAGLLAAAMSTLDSSINASAATVTNDFYRRFYRTDLSEEKYLKVGRIISMIFGALMIAVALIIHYSRTETLADLQSLLTSVLSGGLLALFWLGFFTKRVSNKVAALSVVFAISASVVWLFVPSVSKSMPDKFWMIILLNITSFIIGILLSLFIKPDDKNLEGLTVWTINHKEN
ncbi:MAG: sodium:solute symporter [Sedimentisphaeraceae bacterium JB056]